MLSGRWRSRRGDNAPEVHDDSNGTSWDDVTDFGPRADGDYRCAELGIILRFSRPSVIETDPAHDQDAHGEFTTSGRFTVQRPFARAIVYTVLDEAPDGALVIRRTDTNDRSSSQVTFSFVPDSAR